MKQVSYKSGIESIYEKGTDGLALIPENRDICGGQYFSIYLSRSPYAEELYESYLDGAKVEFDGTVYFDYSPLLVELSIQGLSALKSLKSKALRAVPRRFTGKLLVDGTAVYKVSMERFKSESLISKIEG